MRVKGDEKKNSPHARKYLSFAGGLRLLEVSVPEEVEDGDLDLEPEAEEEPV
jgi:hypothetical protein